MGFELLLTCADGCVGKWILKPAGGTLAFVWMYFSCGFHHLMGALYLFMLENYSHCFTNEEPWPSGSK